ncbi:MAG TPA: general secretion pathway protein GspB [Steroidobacteraceae bacterium]|jgi:general secretion pathway protein B|nr:general secretion pathway protein GspB [Steroidobacteraceae bacterium]
MSFILDALKKSEIERQRQSMPGLMDAPAVLRSGRLPLWAICLGALLAINIAVLSVMLMRNGRPGAAAPVRHDTAAAVEKRLPADEHFSPLSQEPVYAPEIPLPPSGETTPAKNPPAPLAASRAPAQRAAPHAIHHPDPVLVDEDAKDDDELLPSINQLNLTGAQALPELHLDVHVYATKPADRFVYINMRKYHEGNTLQEGPVLERIRRDGVVLSYQGLRFLLPRQS